MEVGGAIGRVGAGQPFLEVVLTVAIRVRIPIRDRAVIDERTVKVCGSLDYVDKTVIDDGAVRFEHATIDGAQDAVVGDALTEDKRAAIGQHHAASIYHNHTVDR